jgi:hypothetical protein
MGRGHWQDKNGGAELRTVYITYDRFVEMCDRVLPPEFERNAAAMRVRFRRKAALILRAHGLGGLYGN